MAPSQACWLTQWPPTSFQAQASSSSSVQRGTSVPGRVRQVPGGVGRNVAEGISRILASGV
jgi:hypothetical protein